MEIVLHSSLFLSLCKAVALRVRWGVQALSGAIQGRWYTKFYGTDRDETKEPGPLANGSAPELGSHSGGESRHLGPSDKGEIT